jgi:hypothetical protein
VVEEEVMGTVPLVELIGVSCTTPVVGVSCELVLP